MVRKCTEEDRSVLREYLREETVYNTFLLADIEDFGFDSSFQTVYVDEEEDAIKGVYLIFYKNLILYSKENLVNQAFIEKLFAESAPDVVMGKMENVRAVWDWIPCDKMDVSYKMETKDLYLLESGENLKEAEAEIQKGTLADVDDIFDFIQEIPEIKHLYTSKQMIYDRIYKQTGTHYLVREKDKIIAHANSAAACEFTTMIGGVATAGAYRNQKLASQIVSLLCSDILAKGKKPCLFCNQAEEHNLYCKIGFRKAGRWGTIVKGK